MLSSTSLLARCVKRSFPRQRLVCRRTLLGQNDAFCQRTKCSNALPGRLQQQQQFVHSKPFPFQSIASTRYYRSFPEWHRFLSSTVESNESLNEYDIDTEEYVNLLYSYWEGNRPDMILIDVREPEELVESGQIPGTINIPLGEVDSALGLDNDAFEKQYGANKPSPSTDIIFNCRAGVRSLDAIEAANKLGFSSARHYVRGFLGWQEHLEK